MIKKIKRFNESILRLIAGIWIYGFLCGIVGIFVLDRKIYYEGGLFLGLILASIMAVHMAWALNRGVSLEQKEAVGFLQKQNILRYFSVTILLAIVMITNLINPLAAFLGIMGLKAGAYMSPFIERLEKRSRRKPDYTENI